MKSMTSATWPVCDDPAGILKELPERLGDVLEPWVRESPDQPALVEAGASWTYRQLDEVVRDTQEWLIDLGIRSGDRVMLVGENCRAFVVILLALSNLDAWAVLVNARLSAREVDEIRAHSGARRALYTTRISVQAREHARRHGASIKDHPSLGQLAVSPPDETVRQEALDSDRTNNVAALIYTSGTTGVPKGVMLTHRNLLFVAAVSARIRSLGPADLVYGILPMSHAVGLSVVLLGALWSGATLYLSSRFDPAVGLQALENDRLTVVLGVPAMFAMLVDYAKSKGRASLNFPWLRIISSSGAPLDSALKAQVEEFFQMPLYNGYGVTECSPNIAQAKVDEPRKDTSVGKVFPGIEVKLVGGEGRPVAEGEVGELHVRGPNVMKGYYRAPEETAAALDREGWFNTRDLARLEDGNLFIVGRTKELIVRFGFNVYPAEIEGVLNTHPAVARSGVIGRAVEGTEGGEEIVAFVEPEPAATLTKAELADHAARHLVPYKRPSEFVVLRSLPLTPTGKVKKDELSAMLKTLPA